VIDPTLAYIDPLFERLEADAVLAERFLPSPAEAADGAPERRLMVAVLTNAVLEFFRCHPATTRRKRRLLHEVEEWFAARDLAWPFSFENICTALGLDAGALRSGLLRWKSGLHPGGTRRVPGQGAFRRTAAQRPTLTMREKRRRTGKSAA
jgi:hypothetical protein